VLLATAPCKIIIAAKIQRGNSGQMQGRRNRLFEMDNEEYLEDENWLEGEGTGQTGME